MVNKKYLPSKKFLIALSIAIVIVVISIIFNYWRSNVTKYVNNNLSVATDTASSSLNIDSDNDGLPDWKEALYGTDPHKADTDGDGTNDGDEVAQDRDPLKANTAPKGQKPNDYIDPAIIEKNKKILDDYEKLSDTEKLSRSLMSNIFASQPINGSIDQNTSDSILANTMGQIPEKDYSGITKITDLKLLKTDSTNLNTNLTQYAKSYYTETQKLIPLFKIDTSIIGSYISNGTSTASDLKKVIEKYQSIVNNLIKMPVPVAIGYYDINYHLTVINDLEIIIAIEKDIADSGKDSLGIFSNLSVYNDRFNDLISTLKTIDGILKIQR